MRQFVLILLFAFTVSTSFAQTYTYGIKGGINFSNQGRFYGASDQDVKTYTGFHFGGILDIGFKNFSLQPGLFFTTKGNREANVFIGDPSMTKFSTTTKFNYLELPINFVYKFQIWESAKFFAGGGPYAAYALSGSWYVDKAKLGNVVFGNNGYKRFDYGLNATAGFELKNKIIIGAGYSLGADVLSGPGLLRNHVLCSSVGYLF